MITYRMKEKMKFITVNSIFRSERRRNDKKNLLIFHSWNLNTLLSVFHIHFGFMLVSSSSSENFWIYLQKNCLFRLFSEWKVFAVCFSVSRIHSIEISNFLTFFSTFSVELADATWTTTSWKSENFESMKIVPLTEFKFHICRVWRVTSKIHFISFAFVEWIGLKWWRILRKVWVKIWKFWMIELVDMEECRIIHTKIIK